MCTHTKMVRAYTVVQVLVGHYVSSSVPGFLTCGAVALNIMYRGTGCRWEMGRDRKTLPTSLLLQDQNCTHMCTFASTEPKEILVWEMLTSRFRDQNLVL